MEGKCGFMLHVHYVSNLASLDGNNYLSLRTGIPFVLPN